MSTPGWYPDPGGRPGHYRLWDGRSWGLSTTAEPPGRSPAGPPPRRRHRAPWFAAGAALLVVATVVVALVVRPEPPGAPTPVPSPASVVSSPAGSGGPTGGTPSTSPSDPPVLPATPSAPDSPDGPGAGPEAGTPCPVGNPFARSDHPRDGRVHGGGLSFPRQPGWEDPGPQASVFTWAYDLGETDLQLTQNRYASYAVGAVSVADGFENPRTAAELAMRCTVASALYSSVSGRTDLVSAETTVDGRPAWTLRSEIRTYDARTSFAGDTVQVTVVDLGSPEALAFFWGSAPLGDDTFTARLDRAAEQVHVG